MSRGVHALDDGHPVPDTRRLDLALMVHAWMAEHMAEMPPDTEARLHYEAAMAEACPLAPRWGLGARTAVDILEPETPC